MNFKVDTLTSYIIYLSLIGFPIVGVISQILGTDSYFFSVVLRLSVATLSIVVLTFSIKYVYNVKKNIFLNFIFLFIVLYIFRIGLDTVVFNLPLNQSPLYYWIWFYGVCLLPFLCIVFSKDGKGVNEKLSLYLYISFVVVSILCIIYGNSYVQSSLSYDTYNTGRFRLNSINPISLGHIGVLAFSLSYYYINYNQNKIKLIFSILGMCSGFYLTLLANSRGPLIALFVIFIILTIKKYKYFYIILPIFLIICFTFFLYILNFISNEYDIQTLNRIYGDTAVQKSLEDDRLTLYKNALSGFFSNPLFGSGLEEYKYGFYPHNIYIESLMATGFLGGVCFILSSFYIMIRSLILEYKYFWVSIFYLDNFISGMFSGSIYSSGYFWTSLALVFSVIIFKQRQ